MVALLPYVSSVMCAATMIWFLDREGEITLSRTPHGDCPWCCTLDLNQDVRYYLYTRKHPNKGIIIPFYEPDQTALNAGADPTKATIIFIHGFGERAPSISSVAIKNAYLESGADYNIILVDWGVLSAAPWYINAVRNSRLVGRMLANFLLRVDQSGLFPLDNVHVIGFSLGAESAGFAGKAMPANRRIPRITGLDPAFPLYFGGRNFHLSTGDALFVDVIHTDAGILGYPSPIGDVDFYPNGGKTFQPGCLFEDIEVQYRTSLVLEAFPLFFYGGNLRDMLYALSCSHQRAWRYYVESIRNPLGFPATRCSRWRGFFPPCKFRIENYMGRNAHSRTKGQFYLETNPAPPYAKTALT